MTWVIHLILLGFVSVIIKGVNYTLHQMFDTGEVFEEEAIHDLDSPKLKSQSKKSQGGGGGHLRARYE